MAKTLNHNLKPYIIALLLLLVGLLFFLVSCSEAKKGQKAVNRVNADANLQDQVVGKWFDTHPIDTTPRIVVSPPKIVEVKTEKIVRDEAALKAAIDSFKSTLDTTKDCGEAAMDAFNLGYEQAENKYLSQKTKVPCPPDTTKIYFLTHELNRQKDTINSLRVQQATKEGVIQELRASNSTLKKENNHLEWYLAGSFLLTILSHVVRSYAGGWISSAKNLFKKS